MKFGISKEIITPYFKTTMIGFAPCFGRDFSGIHDDLYARTLILQDDKEKRVILIALDLLFHDYSLTREVQDFAVNEYEIPEENVFVNYTHTHYGPAVKGYDNWHYSEEYEKFLLERITQCIQRASVNMCEGSLEYCAIEGDWNISRRKLENGECKFQPSLLGEKDNMLNTIKLVDTEGLIKGMLYNYSAHPSSISCGRELSSEYPGRLCNLTDNMIYGCTSIFFQGAGGDSKLKSSARGDKFRASYNDVNETAVSMLERVKSTLLSGGFKPFSLGLDARQFTIPVPLEVYPINFYIKQMNEYASNNKDIDLLYRCAKYVVENYDSMPDEIILHAGIIKLNSNQVILTMGGEPSCNVKAILQKAFPDKIMLFFGYCDSIAYIPSDKLVEEGGYEAEGSITEYRLKGRIKPGVDDLYRKYYGSILNEMGL